MAKSFDKTVKKMCRQKITDPDAPLLGEVFTVEEAIAAALIKKAYSGAADALKVIREILSEQTHDAPKTFTVDINVVE